MSPQYLEKKSLLINKACDKEKDSSLLLVTQTAVQSVQKLLLCVHEVSEAENSVKRRQKMRQMDRQTNRSAEGRLLMSGLHSFAPLFLIPKFGSPTAVLLKN